MYTIARSQDNCRLHPDTTTTNNQYQKNHQKFKNKKIKIFVTATGIRRARIVDTRRRAMRARK
jgi:hypothetical protein